MSRTTGVTLEAWVNPTSSTPGWRDVIMKGQVADAICDLYADTGGVDHDIRRPLSIGGDRVGGDYFQGLIHEARVSNRALPVSGIRTDMALGVAGSGIGRRRELTSV